MKSEFVIERQGKSFVLYAGLLDLAHQNGLKSISTELVQAPTAENGRQAIVAAVVILECDGMERHFTGLGDADPTNVAHNMQNCLLRLAETRAKARALRDAVNIGTAALEELGEESAGIGTAGIGVAAQPIGSTQARIPPAGLGNKCPYCKTSNEHHRHDCPNRAAA